MTINHPLQLWSLIPLFTMINTEIKTGNTRPTIHGSLRNCRQVKVGKPSRQPGTPTECPEAPKGRRRYGLEGVDRQPPGKIGGKQRLEEQPGCGARAGCRRRKANHKRAAKAICRVGWGAGDAVAKIDPRAGRWGCRRCRRPARPGSSRRGRPSGQSGTGKTKASPVERVTPASFWRPRRRAGRRAARRPSTGRPARLPACPNRAAGGGKFGPEHRRLVAEGGAEDAAGGDGEFGPWSTLPPRRPAQMAVKATPSSRASVSKGCAPGPGRRRESWRRIVLRLIGGRAAAAPSPRR